MLNSLPAVLVVLALAAAPATAQQAVTQSAAQTAATDTRPTADSLRRDSLAVEIPADLRESLAELTATLERLSRRVANDPELRASAVRTAQSFGGVAQFILVQQADLIQDALRTAAERLEDIVPPAAQQRR